MNAALISEGKVRGRRKGTEGDMQSAQRKAPACIAGKHATV